MRRAMCCTARRRTGSPRFAAHTGWQPMKVERESNPRQSHSKMRCSTRLSYPVVEHDAGHPRHAPRQRRAHRTGGLCRPEPEPLRNASIASRSTSRSGMPIRVGGPRWRPRPNSSFSRQRFRERKRNAPEGIGLPGRSRCVGRSAGPTFTECEVRSLDERGRALAFEPWRVRLMEGGPGIHRVFCGKIAPASARGAHSTPAKCARQGGCEEILAARSTPM